jgi:hypothetical protein
MAGHLVGHLPRQRQQLGTYFLVEVAGNDPLRNLRGLEPLFRVVAGPIRTGEVAVTLGRLGTRTAVAPLGPRVPTAAGALPVV